MPPVTSIVCLLSYIHSFFFFNDTATTEIYTLSLHDALPIYSSAPTIVGVTKSPLRGAACITRWLRNSSPRSEEHTSELQSRLHLVCRLLLEKKKKSRSSHVLAPLWFMIAFLLECASAHVRAW